MVSACSLKPFSILGQLTLPYICFSRIPKILMFGPLITAIFFYHACRASPFIK